MTKKIKTSPEYDSKFMELVKILETCGESEDCDMCKFNYPARFKKCNEIFTRACGCAAQRSLYKLPKDGFNRAVNGLRRVGCVI